MAWSRLKILFRSLLSNRSKNSANEPTLAPEIAHAEDFTRFIFTDSHFAATTGRVKPPALMPLFSSAKNRYETSTHRIRELASDQIWQLGYSHVENAQQRRNIKARGTGRFELATSQGLALDVNGPPYPRHVDIIGWSESDKSMRLMQATEIADKLLLEVDPRS